MQSDLDVGNDADFDVGPGPLAALWRYRVASGLILLTAVLVGAVILLTNKPPVVATARVGLANPRSLTVVLGGASSGADLGRYAAAQARFAESADVLAVAAETLGDGTTLAALRGSVDVTESPSADVLVVTARGGRADEAVRRADAVVAAYQELTERTTQDAVNRQLGAVDRARAELRQQIALAPADDPVSAAAVAAATTALGELEQAAARARTEAALFGDGTLFVEPASPRARPGQLARAGRGALLGALVGVLLAGAVTWVHAGRRREVADGPTAARLLGTRLLGEIPAPDERLRGELDDPVAAPGPGYHAAAVAIAAAAPRGLFVVTSPARRDGRTTTVIKLGLALAAAGTSVALVDADLRTGQLTSRFGLPRGLGGLGQLVAGSAELASAQRVFTIADGANLTVVPCGQLVGEPAGLLRRPAAGEVFAELRAAFEVVVVDTPAAGPTADAFALAQAATGLIVVVRRGTPAALLRRLRAQAMAADATLLGLVFTHAAGGRVAYPADGRGGAGRLAGVPARAQALVTRG
ncbi:MAG: hypothetical protein IRZ08_14790 [Frankia sp.]|nr:hypothetical protein [Frankia sp.]